MKIKLNGKAVLLLTVLLFPSLFYVLLSSGKHNFITRPYFGPKLIDEQMDTVYHQVGEINYLECGQVQKRLTDLRGKIVVIHFIGQANTTEDKRKCSQLMAIEDRFEAYDDVQLLSLFLDDSTTDEQVCAYTNAYEVNNGHWIIGKAQTHHKIRDALIFDLPNEIRTKKWTNLFVLLDKKGHIRSYRDGVQYVEEKALIDDIKILKAEEQIPRKERNGAK